MLGDKGLFPSKGADGTPPAARAASCRAKVHPGLRLVRVEQLAAAVGQALSADEQLRHFPVAVLPAARGRGRDGVWTTGDVGLFEVSRDGVTTDYCAQPVLCY